MLTVEHVPHCRQGRADPGQSDLAPKEHLREARNTRNVAFHAQLPEDLDSHR